jgi:hypothetical protein
VRELADGAAVPFMAKRWVQYAILIAGILAIVTSASEIIDLVTTLAIAIGGALLAVAAQWFRRKLERRGIRITGEGWLMLATIVVVVAWAALNARAIASRLFLMAEDWDMSEGMAMVAVIVLLHIPLAFLAAGLAKCLPKVWSDIRSLAGRT